MKIIDSRLAILLSSIMMAGEDNDTCATAINKINGTVIQLMQPVYVSSLPSSDIAVTWGMRPTRKHAFFMNVYSVEEVMDQICSLKMRMPPLERPCASSKCGTVSPCMHASFTGFKPIEIWLCDCALWTSCCLVLKSPQMIIVCVYRVQWRRRVVLRDTYTVHTLTQSTAIMLYPAWMSVSEPLPLSSIFVQSHRKCQPLRTIKHPQPYTSLRVDAFWFFLCLLARLLCTNLLCLFARPLPPTNEHTN